MILHAELIHKQIQYMNFYSYLFLLVRIDSMTFAYFMASIKSALFVVIPATIRPSITGRLGARPAKSSNVPMNLTALEFPAPLPLDTSSITGRKVKILIPSARP